MRATLNVTREGDSTATTQNAAFAGATTPTVCTLNEDGELPAGNSARFEWLLVPRGATPHPTARRAISSAGRWSTAARGTVARSEFQLQLGFSVRLGGRPRESGQKPI